MSKRIEIPIGLQTTEVRKGATDAEKALRDLEDAVGDTGKGGAKDLDRLEDELKDVQRQSERTERSMEDIGDSGERGFRKLGDTGAEVSDELRSNLGETFSSFRGDLEDLPQIAQDTLGGLAGSGALGGIAGLAATAAGAAGLGLVIGAMENIDAAAQASRERINDWASAFTEAGAKVLDASIIQSRMADILTDTDGKLKDAKTNAELWGVSVADAALAMAGHQPTLTGITDDLDKQADAWVRLTENGYTFTDAEREKFQVFQEARAAIGQINDEMAEGASVVDIMSAANLNLINSTQGVVEEVDELGNRLYTLPDGLEIMIDAETGIATQNVEKFKGDLDGVPQNVTSQVTVNVDKRQLDSAISAYDRLQARANRGIDIAFNRTGRQLLGP